MKFKTASLVSLLIAICCLSRPQSLAAQDLTQYEPGDLIQVQFQAEWHDAEVIEVLSRIVLKARFVDRRSKERDWMFGARQIRPMSEEQSTQVEKPTQTVPQSRTWASASGKFKQQAVYVSHDDESVKLKKSDGEILTVKLDALCQADNDYVLKIASDAEAAESTVDDQETKRSKSSNSLGVAPSRRFTPNTRTTPSTASRRPTSTTPPGRRSAGNRSSGVRTPNFGSSTERTRAAIDSANARMKERIANQRRLTDEMANRSTANSVNSRPGRSGISGLGAPGTAASPNFSNRSTAPNTNFGSSNFGASPSPHFAGNSVTPHSSNVRPSTARRLSDRKEESSGTRFRARPFIKIALIIIFLICGGGGAAYQASQSRGSKR